MASTRFSEDIRPLTELKTRTSALVAQVLRSRRPMLLTRRGRGVAVLLDLEEYERLLDRAAFVAAVKEGVQAVEAGDLHAHAEADRILDAFGERDGD